MGISAANIYDGQALIALVRIPPIDHGVVPGADSLASYTETRATIVPTCGDGWLLAASGTVSPQRHRVISTAWPAPLGRRADRVLDAAAATSRNGSRNVSSPSPPSLQPSYATADSPTEMAPYFTTLHQQGERCLMWH
jgi:hypothetical protein